VTNRQLAVASWQFDLSCFWLTDFIRYLVSMLINQLVKLVNKCKLYTVSEVEEGSAGRQPSKE